MLKPGNLAYCAGVGEDLTFDAELLKRGLRVVAFNPTPRSVEYARTADLGPAFDFEDVGWWDTTGSERFYAPADPTHVSHSVVNLQGTVDFFVGKVETVRSVMDRRGDDVPHLIKMDIEGSGFRVLRSMIGTDVRPMVLCVEFNQPAPLGAVLIALLKPRKVGYRVESVEGWNLTLVRQ